MVKKSALIMVLALTLAGCATNDGVNDTEAARASCEEQNVAAGVDMAECIERTVEQIRSARDHIRNPPQPARPSQPPR
jgi:outer membrane lipoprotein SlyB